MELLIGLFFILLLVGGTLLYFSLSWAFVAYKSYHWFILPIFTTMPDINFITMLGITLFIGTILDRFKVTQKTTKKDYEWNDDTKKQVLTALVVPWFILLIQYLFWVVFF